MFEFWLEAPNSDHEDRISEATWNLDRRLVISAEAKKFRLEFSFGRIL